MTPEFAFCIPCVLGAGNDAQCVTPASTPFLLQLETAYAGVRLSEKAHLAVGYTVAAWAPEAVDESSPGTLVPPSLLAVGSRSGTITLWDTARGEVIARLGGDAPAAPLAAASGSKRPRPEQAAGTARHVTAISALVWSPDGTRLFAGAESSGTVISWDVAARRPAQTFAVDRRGCSALALSRDGATLFAAYTDILVIDAASGRSLKRLAGHALPVTALAVAAEDDVRRKGAADAAVCVGVACL